MRSLWFLGLFVLGCGSEEGLDGDSGGPLDTEDPDSDTDIEPDSDTDADTLPPPDTDDIVTNTWTGDANGGPAPTSTPLDSQSFNLVAGAPLESFAWASQAYCFPGNLNDRFTGNHLAWFAPTEWPGTWDGVQQGGKDLYLRVTPDDGVDVSVYAMTGSSDLRVSDVPPDTVPGHVFECDETSAASNPSQPEVLCLSGYGISDQNVILGVAGAEGHTAGSFSVEVWEVDTTLCN